MAISMFFGTPIIEGNYGQFDFPVSSIEMEVKITIYLEEGGELLFDNYKPDKRFCRFLYGYWKGVIDIESDSEEGYRFSNDQHSRRLFAERMRKGYSSIMISAPTCFAIKQNGDRLKISEEQCKSILVENMRANPSLKIEQLEKVGYT